MDVSSRSLDPGDLEFRAMGTQSDLDLLKCTFCGKRNEQVKMLIAGPSVYICSESLHRCNEIIEVEVPSWRWHRTDEQPDQALTLRRRDPRPPGSPNAVPLKCSFCG